MRQKKIIYGELFLTNVLFDIYTYMIFDKDFSKYKCQLLLRFGNQKSFYELTFCEQAQSPPVF